MGNKKLEATTQTEEVLLYLRKHGRITTMEAATKLFIADLQGVIRNLKKKMIINYEWVYKKNIYGRPIRYKRYYIEPEDRLSLFDRLRYFL